MARRNDGAPTASKGLATDKFREVWTKLSTDNWALLLGESADSVVPSGPHFKIRCEWHSDSKPSMMVTPSKQIAHCFACGKTFLDPVQLLAGLRKQSIGAVGAMLRKRFGLKVLSEALLDASESNAKTTAQLARFAEFCCNQLLEASKLWPDLEALTRAGLYYARPSIEYLRARLGDGDYWRLLCDDQLAGVLPPLASIRNAAGSAALSREHAEASLGLIAPLSGDPRWVGALVLPSHSAPFEVSSIKVRLPSSEVKDFRMLGAAPNVASDRRGYYGLHSHRIVLGDGEGGRGRYVKEVVVMEGEFDALQAIVNCSELESYAYLPIASGGGSSESLDPLARLGLKRIRLVQDNDEGGVSNTARLARLTQDPGLSLSIFKWPSPFGEAKDPDEALRSVGHARWARAMATPTNFEALPAWCVDRAVAEVERGRVAGDDAKQRAAIASEWGRVLHDKQELRAYCHEVGEALGVDSKLLERDIERYDEDEDQFLDTLREAILGQHAPIGQRDGVLRFMHRRTRAEFDVPLEDERAQAAAFARYHGAVVDMIRSLTGDPAYLAPAAEKSTYKRRALEREYRNYINQVMAAIARDVPSLDHAKKAAQGVHYVDNTTAYVVNGRDVYRLHYLEGGAVAVDLLAAPVDHDTIFDTKDPPWFVGLTGDDLTAEVSLARLFDRICAMLDAGWAFRHQKVDVVYLAAFIMTLTVASALRRQLAIFVTGDRESGKSRLTSGLIGGTQFPSIGLVAHARGMSGFTAASIRQSRHDSPICLALEEFEDYGTEDRKTAAVRGVLEMLRDMIGEDPVEISIGTPTGESKVYRLRFPLVACAIRPLKDAASLSRFVLFETVKDPTRADPVVTLINRWGHDEIMNTRKDLAVGLLRHMTRLRALEDDVRTELTKAGALPSYATSRFREALHPILALLRLVREDATARGELTAAPEWLSYAKEFAATRETGATRQDDAALGNQLVNALLAAAVTVGSGYDRATKTIRQLLAKATENRQLATGVYYYFDKAERKWLVVAWDEAAALLIDTVWPKQGAGHLRQLAERHPLHLSNEEIVAANVLAALEAHMGRGHVVGRISVFDAKTFVKAEKADAVANPGEDGGAVELGGMIA